MSKEFSEETTLWLRLKNISPNATSTDNIKTVLVEDIEKDFSRIVQQTEINLSLSSNQLTNLPINFTEHLLKLTSLNLSDNQLNNLPDCFNSLKNLQHFYLNNNQFSSIPLVINELKSLRTLKVQKNKIRDITINFNNLKHLEEVDLSSNLLSNLPPTMRNSNLRCLSIADNKFSKIPDCVMNGLRNLQVFDFSQNYNAELNIPPNSIKLKRFYAIKNGVCPFFPQWILQLRYQSLETVVLDQTEFDNCNFPENQLNCYINKLSMRNCSVTDSPIKKILAGMVNLEELKIGNESSVRETNAFWSVPIKSVKRPSCLKHIDLRCTGIPMMHGNIGDFVNLISIDIGVNSLSWFPDEICTLKRLKSLKVNNNSLAILPQNIGNMESLEELIACHNNLCELPDSIKFLKKLKFLDLHNNEFESLPEQIAKMPNLLGLDLERNFFSTESTLVDREVPHYKTMKAVLREHWNDSNKLCDGPKVEQIPYPEDQHYFSSKSSNCSSTEYNYNENYNFCSDFDLSDNLDTIENEVWGVSQDSADEFDPNELQRPRSTTISPLAFYQNKYGYCPGEAHETRVISRVSKMLQDGTLYWPTDFEDGQFEDPEDNK